MNDQAPLGLGIAELIGSKRSDILRLAAEHGAYNVRVFGSVARSEAHPQGDVDFVVEFCKGATIWDAVGLWQDLTALLQREVDLLTDSSLDEPFKEHVLKDAVPL